MIPSIVDAMSEGTTPSEVLDTRFSTPAPELDDHRHRLRLPASNTVSPADPRGAEQRLDIPHLEIQEPTPRPSETDPMDLLHVDRALRLQEATPVRIDFDSAISDGEGSDIAGISPTNRRGSGRRDTRRGRRPPEFRHDRSRDSSSSRSTSPANSVEAFAEPRRRQRAGTINSERDSIDLPRQRAGSHADSRRPTLSHISLPPGLRSRTNQIEDDERRIADFETDSDPGKTYKIDFEELEEFVALCKQGKIPNHAAASSARVFQDQRHHPAKPALPNAVLNGENFYEKPLEAQWSSSEDTKTDSRRASILRAQIERDQPDRFTFFSTDVQHPRCARSLVDLVDEETKFQDLFDVGPEGGVWWLDVLNPTNAELDVIASAFKIHRLTREDIETQEPREKVELFSQYYFVCFRSFNMNRLSEDFLDPIHLYIIVTTDGVLSFSYTPNPHAKNVRKRIAKLGDFVSLGPDYICYALIDDIVDSFAPTIRDAEEESENIEDQVFIARDEDFSALLRQIGEARKRVLNMMRLLGGKADVIKGFAKRCNEQFEMTPRGDIGLYLGDIQDHVVTMMSNLGHVEKMLSRSHANYLAQLNVDNLLKGNHTNKALAKITVVATILVPLNLITGLFGMNVHVPGEGGTNLHWFAGIVSVIGLFVVCSLILARRLRLI